MSFKLTRPTSYLPVSDTATHWIDKKLRTMESKEPCEALIWKIVDLNKLYNSEYLQIPILSVWKNWTEVAFCRCFKRFAEAWKMLPWDEKILLRNIKKFLCKPHIACQWGQLSNINTYYLDCLKIFLQNTKFETNKFKLVYLILIPYKLLLLSDI